MICQDKGCKFYQYVELKATSGEKVSTWMCVAERDDPCPARRVRLDVKGGDERKPDGKVR